MTIAPDTTKAIREMTPLSRVGHMKTLAIASRTRADAPPQTPPKSVATARNGKERNVGCAVDIRVDQNATPATEQVTPTATPRSGESLTSGSTRSKR